jgi:hypothetical protein
VVCACHDRIGSPYRIALSVGNDGGFDDNVLVDHLQHNDDGNTPKRHKYKVVLPDINCTQCALQLIQVVTNTQSTGIHLTCHCNATLSRTSMVLSDDNK